MSVNMGNGDLRVSEANEHTRKMGAVLGRHHEELQAKHPPVGGHRHIGRLP